MRTYVFFCIISFHYLFLLKNTKIFSPPIFLELIELENGYQIVFFIIFLNIDRTTVGPVECQALLQFSLMCSIFAIVTEYGSEDLSSFYFSL